MAKPKGQPERRRDLIYTDTHGRQWHAVIELATGDPCSPFMPRFIAPLMPHQKYIRLVKGEHGKIFIDYERWIGDLREAHQNWHKQLRFHATRLFGDKAAEAVSNPTPALLDAVGPKPPFWEPVDAARKGNKWILGLVPLSAKPPWAEKFFPAVVQKDDDYPDVDYGDVEDTHESWKKPKQRKNAA